MTELNLPKGGVVVGVGVDLVEVDRIRKVCERHPERFLSRVFTREEQDYCLKMKDPYPHLAARFAAKEAVSKAFTTGIGAELGWTSVGVRKGERGDPYVEFDEQGKELLRRVGASDVLLTLAHTSQHAQAVAILVK